MQNSRTKLAYVTFTWWTLYLYQVLSWWHVRFLRYWHCLFCTSVDPMTLMKVRGHQQWYRCVELSGGYRHTTFDSARYHSLWKSPNFKFRTNFSVSQLSPLNANELNTTGVCDIHLMCFISIPSFILLTCAVPQILKLPVWHKCWTCDLDKGQRSPTKL